MMFFLKKIVWGVFRNLISKLIEQYLYDVHSSKELSATHKETPPDLLLYF